jgi:Putative Zn-dependent protease, contains TPR repeats
VSAANNLATHHTEGRGDKETAVEFARRAEEADPDDPHTSNTRGWTLFKRGVYQRSPDLLRASTKKLLNDPVIQYYYGRHRPIKTSLAER